MRIVIYTSG